MDREADVEQLNLVCSEALLNDLIDGDGQFPAVSPTWPSVRDDPWDASFAADALASVESHYRASQVAPVDLQLPSSTRFAPCSTRPAQLWPNGWGTNNPDFPSSTSSSFESFQCPFQAPFPERGQRPDYWQLPEYPCGATDEAPVPPAGTQAPARAFDAPSRYLTPTLGQPDPPHDLVFHAVHCVLKETPAKPRLNQGPDNGDLQIIQFRPDKGRGSKRRYPGKKNAGSRRVKPFGPERPPRSNPIEFSFESHMTKFHSKQQVKRNYEPEEKEEVATTRRTGPCFPCRWEKRKCRRCNAFDRCEHCATTLHLLRTICFRLDLSDCGFYRTKSAIQPAPFRQTLEWTSSTTVDLELRMPKVPGARSLFIKCRRFQPVETDLTGDWLRGNEAGAVVEVPTYAAIDLTAVQAGFRLTAQAFGTAFLDVMKKNDSSPVVVHILRSAFAYTHRRPGSIVTVALNIWSCSRMCARERSLAGEETLGQNRVVDPTSPYLNHIPIPPVLDYQCDTVIMRWMNELAEGLMKSLWNLVQENKKEKAEWLEVFLTVFIIINNLEFVVGIAKELGYQYRAKAGDTGIRIQKTTAEWNSHWRWSAQHLLLVYKKFFHARYPFSDQALTDARGLVGWVPDRGGTRRRIQSLDDFNTLCLGVYKHLGPGSGLTLYRIHSA